jgi:hypothetical protein
MAFVREHEARAARSNHSGDLRRFIGGVERNRDGADPQDAQIGGAPPRVVVGKDGDAVARPDTAVAQPDGGRLGGGPQLPIGDALDSLPALDFDRDAIAERRRGPVEEIVESDAGL